MGQGHRRSCAQLHRPIDGHRGFQAGDILAVTSVGAALRPVVPEAGQEVINGWAALS